VVHRFLAASERNHSTTSLSRVTVTVGFIRFAFIIPVLPHFHARTPCFPRIAAHNESFICKTLFRTCPLLATQNKR
jgi:hypothetical protein